MHAQYVETDFHVVLFFLFFLKPQIYKIMQKIRNKFKLFIEKKAKFYTILHTTIAFVHSFANGVWTATHT